MIRSVLSADQFDRAELDQLLSLTHEIESLLKRRKQIPLLEQYVLATLFFEPSTRTRLSFETAMHRLGGRVITSVGFQFSSLAKGETLFDTLKMVEGYSDICVIRHPHEGASAMAAQNLKIPVINGGDGAGEHPTQALLDLYTIDKNKPLNEQKLKIAFVGDIKYGRTIHSLYRLLTHFDIEMSFISPDELKLSEKDRNNLKEKGVRFRETENIEETYNADIIYVTRIQEERFLDHNEFERFSNIYVVNQNLLDQCKEDVIIMHPLPRLNELSTNIDHRPNAVYFEQAQNGVYIRMALLLSLLGVSLH